MKPMLWARQKKPGIARHRALTPQTKARNSLVEQYAPLVDRIAESQVKRHGGEKVTQTCFGMTRDDVISAGHRGLLDAAERFSSKHRSGARFGTFAGKRIVGRILDEIKEGARRGTGVTTRAIEHKKNLPFLEEKLERLGKGKKSRVKADRLRRSILAARAAERAQNPKSLSLLSDFESGVSGKNRRVPEPVAREPRQVPYETRDFFMKRIRRLEPVEGFVFMIRFLHPTIEEINTFLGERPFYRDFGKSGSKTTSKDSGRDPKRVPFRIGHIPNSNPLSLKEIGSILGVSESRASQIMSSAIRKFFSQAEVKDFFGIGKAPPINGRGSTRIMHALDEMFA